MKTNIKLLAALFAPLALAAVIAPAAHAGDHRYALSPNYLKECGSCHVAFPPALLPAQDWQTIMNSLDKHYGTDASLDAKTRDALTAELQRNASRRDKHAGRGQPPRLTRSAWFEKEHGTLPEKRTATLPAAAQCEVCHSRAAEGDYAESGIKLPANYRKER
jgi:hypothetical protein